MTTKLYDLAVAVSKYTAQDGSEKSRWENVGSVWQDTDNQGNKYSFVMLKATFNPAAIKRKDGSDSIRLSLFKPKDKKQGGSAQGNAQYNNNSQGNHNAAPQFDAPQPQSYEGDNEISFGFSDESAGNIEECPF